MVSVRFQRDGELQCPRCRTGLRDVAEPLAAELERLFQIEGAARRLVDAGPPDDGERYVKDEDAPAGARRMAWKRLAMLLDDGPRPIAAQHPA